MKPSNKSKGGTHTPAKRKKRVRYPWVYVSALDPALIEASQLAAPHTATTSTHTPAKGSSTHTRVKKETHIQTNTPKKKENEKGNGK